MVIEKEKEEKAVTQIANPEQGVVLSKAETVRDQKVAKFRRASKEEQPTGKCPIKYIPANDMKDGISGIGAIAIKDSDTTINAFDNALKSLTATGDVELAFEIISKGVGALPKDGSAQKFNIVSQSLANSVPKDAIESKFCMQEMALYAKGMSYLARAEHCESFDAMEFYIKNAIKLLRLRNETIEAMNRHRRGGEQRVVVQHVSVNEGGQAIVGGILHGGGGSKKQDETTP